MKVEINVPEVVELFKEIQDRPQKIFDLIRYEIHEVVGRYLTELMKAELTHFLGREHYERKGSCLPGGREGSNHRNGSYDRKFTMKGIGEVSVKVPRDRRGEYATQVLPRGRRTRTRLPGISA